MKTKEQVCEFAKHFEQAILGHTQELMSIMKSLRELKSWGIKIHGICVPPVLCEWMEDEVAELDCKNIFVIGYPYGDTTIRSKLADIFDVLDSDPDALIDFVPNFYNVFNSFEDTEQELRAVREMVPNQLRLIVEVGKFQTLGKFSIMKDFIKLVEDCGFNIIKTSTGTFNKDDTPLQRLHAVQNYTKLPIKVSGGIKTPQEAEVLINDGAEYIGTSSAAKIIFGYMNS